MNLPERARLFLKKTIEPEFFIDALQNLFNLLILIIKFNKKEGK